VIVQEEKEEPKYYLPGVGMLLDHFEHRVHCPEVLTQAQGRAEAERG
jgi:hypothetical protein